MPVEKLLTRPVETLPVDASCSEAAELMSKQNIGPVVVARGGRPLGVVTDRDIVVRRMPIVDDEGQLKGMISLDDLLVLLADQLGALAQTIKREIGAPA